MSSRRRRERSTGPSRDRWVIPYADFVTLLFAFFTALYAVTASDPTQLPSVAAAMREAVSGGPGVLAGGDKPLEPAAGPAVEPDTAQGESLRDAVERELHDDLASKRLELLEDRRGLVLAIPEAFSFDNGSAELSPASAALMARVGTVLLGVPNGVRVEGHTDTTPIRTSLFASNWELSTARATRVVAFFVSSGVPADRLSAAGYSEFRPRADNGSPEGRARNRRVDIVILNEATQAAEEPTPDPHP
jgi:chemotaxis protein MotB